MSKCSESISDTPGVSLIFLAHFDVFCDLLLNRHGIYLILLFIFFSLKRKKLLTITPAMYCPPTDHKNQSKYVHNSAYYIEYRLLPTNPNIASCEVIIYFTFLCELVTKFAVRSN